MQRSINLDTWKAYFQRVVGWFCCHCRNRAGRYRSHPSFLSRAGFRNYSRSYILSLKPFEEVPTTNFCRPPKRSSRPTLLKSILWQFVPGNEVVNCASEMKKMIDTTFDTTIWAGSDFDQRIVLQRIVVDTEME